MSGMLTTGSSCHKCYGTGKRGGEDRPCRDCGGTKREMTALGTELVNLLLEFGVELKEKAPEPWF